MISHGEYPGFGEFQYFERIWPFEGRPCQDLVWPYYCQSESDPLGSSLDRGSRAANTRALAKSVSPNVSSLS